MVRPKKFRLAAWLTFRPGSGLLNAFLRINLVEPGDDEPALFATPCLLGLAILELIAAFIAMSLLQGERNTGMILLEFPGVGLYFRYFPWLRLCLFFFFFLDLLQLEIFPGTQQVPGQAAHAMSRAQSPISGGLGPPEHTKHSCHWLSLTTEI